MKIPLISLAIITLFTPTAHADCSPEARRVLAERFSSAQIDVLCGVSPPNYEGTPFANAKETGHICTTRTAVCSLSTALPVHAPCACGAAGSSLSGTVVSNKLCGKDVQIDVDQTKGSSEYTGFNGLWVGTWDNSTRLCGALILKNARGDGSANVTYVFGSPGKVQPTQLDKKASINSRGQLTFDDGGGHYTFEVKSDNELVGYFESTDGDQRAKFKRAN